MNNLHADASQQIPFYLAEGICNLETEKYEQAKNIFNNIANSQSAYKDAGLWYQALTALKQKDNNGCSNLLKMIPATSVYSTKAKALLEKLND